MKQMMKFLVLSAFFLTLPVDTCRGQSAAAPSIDPQAAKIMQEWNVLKKKNISASMEVVDTMDEVLETGQKIQYSHVRKLKAIEPKQFWLESTGDITNTTIWKDAKIFTLLDRDNNAYAQIAAPGTIEETMDMLLAQYGVRTPLADLLSDDLYSVLMENVKTCRYLGLHYAEGIKCHHIAATQKDIDWQIWIDAGDVPRPRKILITYKQMPGEPQYTAILKSFDADIQLPEDTFTFNAPEGSNKISFLPVPKPVNKAPEKEL